MMLEEKKARQENDNFKGAEVCLKIVSLHYHHLNLLFMILAKLG